MERLPVAQTLMNQKFDKLEVIGIVKIPNRAGWGCLCRCECGKTARVRPDGLTKGRNVSCGCDAAVRTRRRNLLDNPSKPRGGPSKHPNYNVWCGMIKRCYDPDSKDFKNYGGRGISVCERWRSDCNAFLEDMGFRPEGTSLDRFPDNNGNYEPGNCRWASIHEQANNRRTTIYVEIDGVSKPQAVWCRELNVNYETARKKLKTASDKGGLLATMATRNGDVE